MSKINAEFCFYHLEKCAGSSLRTMFYEYFLNLYKEDEIYMPELNENFNLDQQNYKKVANMIDLNKIKVVLSHMNYGNSYIEKSNFNFTCIRNPVDRIISHYYFFDYQNYNKHLREFTDEELKSVIKTGNLMIHRLSNGSNNLHEVNENMKKMDYIMIYENLNDDIKELNCLLKDKYQIDAKLELPHRNKTGDNNENNTVENYKKYVDMNLKKKILQFCTKDMELYNFIHNMKENRKK